MPIRQFGYSAVLVLAATAGIATVRAEEPSGRKQGRNETGINTDALLPKGTGSNKSEGGVYKFSEGKAQTSMFGLVGEGYKFVYVVDRSGSMGGAGKLALRAVKEELKRSLETLDDIHQFQIIFYNERPSVFNPSGIPGKLGFADKRTKERATSFVDAISAEGGTRHDEALKLALRLHPDVIYLLTDGDTPQLSDREIDGIREKAVGTTIHTIEFGLGPPPGEKSFLAKLAERNGGQYTYVDLSERMAKPKKPLTNQ